MKPIQILRAPKARPTAAQLAWHQMERTMFIHYGPSSWQGSEYDMMNTPLSEINPTKLDVAQWCEAAKSFGAKQIVFVAKHVGGFCWWQTKTNDYSVKSIPWRDGKGDVLDDLYHECQKNGLQFGVYLSPADESMGTGVGGRTKDPAKQEAYNEIYRRQMVEICSNYDIDELWCDGGIVVPIADLIEKYCPNAVIFQGREKANIRWCGNEKGITPYPSYDTIRSDLLKTGQATSMQSDPDGDAWAGMEVDTTLYDHHWFWSPQKEAKRKSLAQLMKIYYCSVGRGEVLLLNANPNTDGLIPDGDMKRYAEFGAEIERRFGSPIGKTTLDATGGEVQFDSMCEVNHVQIREDIAYGQRVRKFTVDAHTENGWETVYEGVTVGNRHIAVFETVAADAIRVDVLCSCGNPKIMELTAHNVTGVDIKALIAELNAPTEFHDGMKKLAHNRHASDLREDMKAGEYIVDLSFDVKDPGQYYVYAEFCGKPVAMQNVCAYIDGTKHADVLTPKDDGFVFSRTGFVVEHSSSKIGFTMDVPADWDGNSDIIWYITRL